MITEIQSIVSRYERNTVKHHINHIPRAVNEVAWQTSSSETLVMVVVRVCSNERSLAFMSACEPELLPSLVVGTTVPAFGRAGETRPPGNKVLFGRAAIVFTRDSRHGDSVRIAGRFSWLTTQHYRVPAEKGKFCVGFPICEIQEIIIPLLWPCRNWVNIHEMFRRYMLIVCTLLSFSCCYCRNIQRKPL